MPGISRAGIKLAIGYAKMSLKGAPSRDVSGLGDVALEARLLAEQSGRQTATFEDVDRAINEHLVPSDTGFAERMAEPEKREKRRTAQASVKEPLTGSSGTRPRSLVERCNRAVAGVVTQDFSGGQSRGDSLRVERELVPA